MGRLMTRLGIPMGKRISAVHDTSILHLVPFPRGVALIRVRLRLDRPTVSDDLALQQVSLEIVRGAPADRLRFLSFGAGRG